MPALPPATAAAFADRARQLLKDAAELTSGRDPNYIRDAQPESIFEKIPLAAARQGCRRYADKPNEYSGRRQARVERACRPYLDSLNYGEGPQVDLPFRGGQCAGVNYTVNWTETQYFSGDCSTLVGSPSVGFRGPIGPVFYAGNAPCPGAKGLQAFLPTGDGPQLIAGAGGGVSITINSVVRQDGLPDNCGNPVPEIRPPIPPPTPGPPREPFVSPPDVDIDIDVEVNPDFSIDVDFGTGPITIDPFGDDDGGGGGGGGGAPPGDVGDPGTPENTGQGGNADGEAPEGTVLTGLRVDFVEPPVGGKEYAPGVYRGVCYIYMGTADGLDHDPAGAMLRSGQFVYAEKDFLTRWSVSANAGYNLRVTPYYRPAEAEE